MRPDLYQFSIDTIVSRTIVTVDVHDRIELSCACSRLLYQADLIPAKKVADRACQRVLRALRERSSNAFKVRARRGLAAR